MQHELTIVESELQENSSRPTLGQLRSVPRAERRGAPARAGSHRANVRAFLVERGAIGVLSREMYERPELYGRSPRNRVSELKKAGDIIGTRWEGEEYRYIWGWDDSPILTPGKPDYWTEHLRKLTQKHNQPLPEFELTP